jgi:hypothetical protein
MAFSWSAAAQGTVNAILVADRRINRFLKLDRRADYAKTTSSHEKYSQKESAAALLKTADELTFARIC